MWLYIALVIPAALYLFRHAILRFLTPRGLPGIPAYPDPKPFWGDLPRFQASMKENGGFSKCFDEMATDLGVISQIRLGFFKTLVYFMEEPC